MRWALILPPLAIAAILTVHVILADTMATGEKVGLLALVYGLVFIVPAWLGRKEKP